MPALASSGRALLRAFRGVLSCFLPPAPGEAVDRGTHRGYLVISLIFVLGPFFLSFDPAAGPAARFGSIPLPPMCLSKELFHTPCPGCQLTRSFILLAHGEPRESIRWHRMGIPLYLFFACQVFYRSWRLRSGAASHEPRAASLKARRSSLAARGFHYFALSVTVLLLANWLVDLLLGSNGF